MSVQRCTESLLVEVVSNETDAAAKDEETVEGPDLDIFIGFFRGEGTTVAQEVDEANGDTAVDVKDKLLEC